MKQLNPLQKATKALNDDLNKRGRLKGMSARISMSREEREHIIDKLSTKIREAEDRKQTLSAEEQRKIISDEHDEYFIQKAVVKADLDKMKAQGPGAALSPQEEAQVRADAKRKIQEKKDKAADHARQVAEKKAKQEQDRKAKQKAQQQQANERGAAHLKKHIEKRRALEATAAYKLKNKQETQFIIDGVNKQFDACATEFEQTSQRYQNVKKLLPKPENRKALDTAALDWAKSMLLKQHDLTSLQSSPKALAEFHKAAETMAKKKVEDLTKASASTESWFGLKKSSFKKLEESHNKFKKAATQLETKQKDFEMLGGHLEKAKELRDKMKEDLDSQGLGLIDKIKLEAGIHKDKELVKLVKDLAQAEKDVDSLQTAVKNCAKDFDKAKSEYHSKSKEFSTKLVKAEKDAKAIKETVGDLQKDRSNELRDLKAIEAKAQREKADITAQRQGLAARLTEQREVVNQARSGVSLQNAPGTPGKTAERRIK